MSMESGIGVATNPNVGEPSTSSAGASGSVVAVQTSEFVRTTTRSQRSLTAYVTRPASVSRQKRLNGLLLKMIVCDLQPFSIIEDAGFREFVTALDPSFTIPSRQVLAKDMLAASYKNAVEKVKAMLDQAEAVSLTTDDAWTSICTDSYIAVTAHFISSDMVLQSCLLECVKYSERHTAENLCNDMKRVITEWGIADKVAAVVTDNAANITAAVRLSGYRHLPCLAHTLNLVVQQAVQSIAPLKDKVKHIVEYFHRSTVAAEKLRSFQLQMNPGNTVLKLKNDVPTRWNSTYYMYQRVCEVQEPLDAAIAVLHNPAITPLTADDWVALREISLVLKPFDAVTIEISAEKSVTVSKVIMLTRGLITACLNIQTGLTNDTAKLLMQQLIEGSRKRFGASESHAVLARATFLDPRFNRNGFYVDSNYTAVVRDVTAAVARKISTPVVPTDAPSSSTTEQAGSNSLSTAHTSKIILCA